MGKTFKKLFGGGKKYTVDDTATKELEATKAEEAEKRIKLYATEGEEAGAKVLSVNEERKRRGNIFGN